MIQCKAYHTRDDSQVTRICKTFRNDTLIRVIQIHISCAAPTHCDTYYHVFVEFENLSKDPTYIPEV